MKYWGEETTGVVFAARLISCFYVLLFAKEKVKYLFSFHLCRIDSSVFDESVRKVLHKYELWGGV